MKPYMPIVVEILNKQAPSTILDAPSGEGWLQTMLKFDTKIDGIDFFERIFGLPQMLYCRNKYNKSKTKEEEIFWKMSGGRQSVFGRRLVVSARVND